MLRRVRDQDRALHQRRAGARVDELGELLEHLGQLVAALAAADVDDDVGVRPLRERLLEHGLAGAEPAGDRGGAAARDREEHVDRPLAGDQRRRRVEPARRPGGDRGPASGSASSPAARRSRRPARPAAPDRSGSPSRRPLTCGGTRIRCSSAAVSATTPSTSPGATRSPSATRGSNSQRRSRSSAGSVDAARDQRASRTGRRRRGRAPSSGRCVPSKMRPSRPGPSSTSSGRPVSSTGSPIRQARGVLVDLDRGVARRRGGSPRRAARASPTRTTLYSRTPASPRATTTGPAMRQISPSGRRVVASGRSIAVAGHGVLVSSPNVIS